GGRRVAPVRAMGPLAYRVDPPRTGGLLMVGDATGFYDPVSGEGIFNGLRRAELAAGTPLRAPRPGGLSAAPLAGYDGARRLAARDKERVTHALHFLISHRALANLTARLLARRQSLLDLLLGVLGDFVPPRALVSGILAR